jgi:hypothetical protein
MLVTIQTGLVTSVIPYARSRLFTYSYLFQRRIQYFGCYLLYGPSCESEDHHFLSTIK